MKIQTLIIISLISLNAFCQSTEIIYKKEIGIWNDSTKTWFFKPIEATNFILSMKHSLIIAYDEDIKVIHAGKVVGHDSSSMYYSTQWKSVDEKKKDCIFSIVDYYRAGFMMIVIVYKDTCIRYYEKPGSYIDGDK
jgi:hypothetical protein